MILTIDPKIDGSDKYYKNFRIQTSGDYKYKVSGENVVGSSQTCSGNCNVSLSSRSKTDIKIYANKLQVYNSGYKEPVNAILDIKKWGDIEWTSFEGSFRGADNLTVSANDKPDLSNVTDMEHMFADADSFNSSINEWDTGNVEDMRYMFYRASDFDKNLSEWDVEKVGWSYNNFGLNESKSPNWNNS